MLATTKSNAAASRGPRSTDVRRTTTTGTIAMRKSDRRFGSAMTAAPRPTVLATSGDEEDTGALVLRPPIRPLAAVVLTEAHDASQIFARLGDVGNPPRRLHPRVPRIVGRDGVLHVAAVAIQQPLEVPDATLDVVLRLEHVRDVVLGRGGGHQLHQSLRTLRRDGAVVER